MDDHSEITGEKPDAPVQPNRSFWQRRLLVIALICSFFSCLAAFSLVIDFFHLFNQMSPLRFWLFQFIANNRVALIVAPLVGLVLSAGALCYVTRDIMSGPVRHLDERQKMIRDQAHGSAYTIMKFVFMIGVLGFILLNTFLPAQNTVAQQQQTGAFTSLGVAYSSLVKDTYNPGFVSVDWKLYNAPVASSATVTKVGAVLPAQQQKEAFTPQIIHPVNVFYFYSVTPNMTQWLASPANNVFFYGTLLLCLFVMITTLPKAVAAWRKRL